MHINNLIKDFAKYMFLSSFAITVVILIIYPYKYIIGMGASFISLISFIIYILLSIHK